MEKKESYGDHLKKTGLEMMTKGNLLEFPIGLFVAGAGSFLRVLSRLTGGSVRDESEYQLIAPGRPKEKSKG